MKVHGGIPGVDRFAFRGAEAAVVLIEVVMFG
jgi:hypothetical protein